MWIPLHVHSSFSTLDGAIPFKKYRQWAEERKLSHVAVTDHYTLSGLATFEKTFEGSDVIPIFGCEIGCEPWTAFAKAARRYCHLNLWATSQEGYYNLIKLVSLGYKDGRRRYGKSIINIDLLKRYSKGLAVGGACEAGELAYLCSIGKPNEALQFIQEIQTVAPFYGEVMRVHTESDPVAAELERKRNIRIRDFCNWGKIPWLVTSDSHYMPGEASYQATMLAVKSLGRKGKDTPTDGPDIDREGTSVSKSSLEASFQSLDLALPNDLEKFWTDWKNDGFEQGLKNTQEFAASIPRISTTNKCLPERQGLNGEVKWLFPKRHNDDRGNMRDIALRGFQELVESGSIPSSERQEYMDQLEMEIGVIERMGFPDYFLLVSDIVRFAKENDILQGPGRGSAAGSMLAWCMGITAVDPRRYALVFERFLNPDRISMPDIDLDFEDDGRAKIIDYLKNSYGSSDPELNSEDSFGSVTAISNVTTFKWKSALRDCLRVWARERGNAFIDKAASTLEDLMVSYEETGGSDTPEQEMMDTLLSSGVFNAEDTDILQTACRMTAGLIGQIRGAGRHASGIVVAPGEITHYAPVWVASDGTVMVQYDMASIEYTGLIKIDCLGLSQLRAIRRTIQIATEKHEAKFNSDSMPNLYDFWKWINLQGAKIANTEKPPILDSGVEKVDKGANAAWNILIAADSTGLFQLESAGMRKLLKSLEPKDVDDLSVLVALFRPGPLGSGMTGDYIARAKAAREGLTKKTQQAKQPKQSAETIHIPEAIDKVLKKSIAPDALGLPVYQEHIMRMGRELAGYTLGEADILRRAMGKKKRDEMDKQRAKFIDGAIRLGFSNSDANTAFDIMEHFAKYGFNKAHSTAYAFIAFVTAWLKANVPASFNAALMEIRKDEKYKKADYINELRTPITDRNITGLGYRVALPLLPPKCDVNEGRADAVAEVNNLNLDGLMPRQITQFNVDPAMSPVLDIRVASGISAPISLFPESAKEIWTLQDLIRASDIGASSAIDIARMIGAGMMEETVGRILSDIGLGSVRHKIAFRGIMIAAGDPIFDKFRADMETAITDAPYFKIKGGKFTKPVKTRPWMGSWLRNAHRACLANPLLEHVIPERAKVILASTIRSIAKSDQALNDLYLKIETLERTIYGAPITTDSFLAATLRLAKILAQEYPNEYSDIRILPDGFWDDAAGVGQNNIPVDLGTLGQVWCCDMEPWKNATGWNLCSGIYGMKDIDIPFPFDLGENTGNINPPCEANMIIVGGIVDRVMYTEPFYSNHTDAVNNDTFEEAPSRKRKKDWAVVTLKGRHGARDNQWRIATRGLRSPLKQDEFAFFEMPWEGKLSYGEEPMPLPMTIDLMSPWKDKTKPYKAIVGEYIYTGSISA